MKISIITINFNNAPGLQKTFDSVFSQTGEIIEYIVIDGGSTDKSVSIIKQFSSYISFWISEPDKGIYDAMNKGIEKASGTYLMFLNSGDTLSSPDVLRKSVTTITNNSAIDIFYGNILVVNDRRVSQKWVKEYPKKMDLDFFRKDTLNHQASFIKSDLFKEFNNYPTEYKLASDFWLFLKSLLSNKKFYHLDFPIVEYDLGGVSGLDYAAYLNEKKIVWQNLVADCVQQIIDERDQYKKLTRGRIMETALKFTARVQALKKRIL